MHCPKCRKSTGKTDRHCSHCGCFLSGPVLQAPSPPASSASSSKFSSEEQKLCTSVDIALDRGAAAQKASPVSSQALENCIRLITHAINRHGGILNSISPKHVRAVFGLPSADENHAQRACSAAVAIRDVLGAGSAQLKKAVTGIPTITIGIASVTLPAGAGHGGETGGETMGDSGRMLALAKPGGIVIAESTEKLVREFFVCSRLAISGNHTSAYRLKGPSGLTTRIEASGARGLTKFTGRDRDAALLLQAFEKARRGSGQVVDIAGEAGIGKSRLVLELRQMPQAHDCHYLEGRCLTVAASTPYHPLLDILRSYLGVKEGEHEAALQLALKKKLPAFGEDGARLLPALQDLFSLNIGDEAYRLLAPPQKRDAVFKAMKYLLHETSRLKPLIMVIEDLHWIDQTSREFLSWFLPSIASSSILLLQLYRPEYVQTAPELPFYQKIKLEQLPPQAGLDLLHALLGEGDVKPEVQELVYGRAGGNPLFMEELTRTLVDAGAIIRSGHSYLLTGNTVSIGVPDTIQGIITARIDRIDKQLKRMLQAASVIGREFERHILQALTGLDDEALKSGLVNLEGLEFISRTRLYPTPAYMFKHALIQDAAYAGLAPGRRQELHEHTGTVIEKLYADRLEEFYELLAHHYTHSSNTEKALEFLTLANAKAIKALAFSQAKSFFEQAQPLFDRLPDLPANRRRRAELMLSQELVYIMLVQPFEYYNLLLVNREAIIGLDDPGLTGAYYACTISAEFCFGHIERCIANGPKAYDLCRAVGDNDKASIVLVTIRWCYFYLADFDRALAMHKNFMELISNPLNLMGYVQTFIITVWSHASLGRWDHALAAGLEALSVSEQYENRNMIAHSCFALSGVCLQQGDIGGGLSYAERACSLAESPLETTWSWAFHGLALCLSGRGVQGIAQIEQSISFTQTIMQVYWELHFWLMLGQGFLSTRRHAEAAQALEKSLAMSRRYKAKFFEGSALRLLGEAHFTTDPHHALQYFEQSLPLLSEIKAENEYAHALAGCGRYYLHTGDTVKGREYLVTALAIFERLGTLREPERIRQELRPEREA